MITWVRKSARLRLFLMLGGDLALVWVVYRLSWVFRTYFELPFSQARIPPERYYVSDIHHYWPVLLLSQVIFLYFFGLYDYSQMRRRGWLLNVPVALALQAISIAAFYFFIGDNIYPRSIFPVFWLFNCVSSAVWRLGLFQTFERAARRRVLIVGNNPNARSVIGEIERHPWMGYEIIGLIGEQAAAARSNGPIAGKYPILGSRDDLAAVVERHRIDEIILAPDSTAWQDRLIDSLTKWDQIPAQILLVPSTFEMLISKTQHLKIRDIPLVEVVRDPFQGPAIYLKQVLDVLLAVVVAIAALPVAVMAALLIYLDTGRPILFVQSRVGKGQRAFDVHKFRTMQVGAESASGATLAAHDDRRRTRVGAVLRKLRIDELPQLINILRGEMSFVGPRPERPEFVNDFLRSIPGYAERFRMKPGITGLAQVHGDYHTSAENKLRYDLVYIYNYSLWMDLRIIVETIKTLIGRAGV